MWSDCNGGQATDWAIIIIPRQELEQQRRGLGIKCPTGSHCVPDVDTALARHRPALSYEEVSRGPFAPIHALYRALHT